MAFTPGDINFGAGTLYAGVLGTPEPVSITGVLDAAWTSLGYTDSGHVFTSGMTVTPINAAEAYYPLTNIVTAKDAKVTFSLLQITAKNLSVAMNGGTTTTISGPSGWTFDPPPPGAEVRTMLLWQSLDNTLRWVGRQCLQVDPSAMGAVKAAGTMIPVGFDLELPAAGGLQPFRFFGNLARLT